MEKVDALTDSLDWRQILSHFILVTLGTVLVTVAVAVFYVPSEIAPSGLTGIAVILNELIGSPIGLVVFLGNIPIQLLYYREVRSLRLIAATVYAIVLYSILLDVLTSLYTPSALTDEAMLNALFGGTLGGVGSGLIYRAGATVGGTSTLARILNFRFGMPLSSSSIYTDTAIIIAAGVVFGWEAAMYATVALVVNRTTADNLLEGRSDSATALIVTQQGARLRRVLLNEMTHGLTTWQATGVYSDERVEVLMLTLLRSEVNALRKLIEISDADAFVTVLQGQATYGRGFKSVSPRMPLRLDEIEDAAATRIDPDAVRDLAVERTDGHDSRGD